MNLFSPPSNYQNLTITHISPLYLYLANLCITGTCSFPSLVSLLPPQSLFCLSLTWKLFLCPLSFFFFIYFLLTIAGSFLPLCFAPSYLKNGAFWTLFKSVSGCLCARLMDCIKDSIKVGLERRKWHWFTKQKKALGRFELYNNPCPCHNYVFTFSFFFFFHQRERQTDRKRWKTTPWRNHWSLVKVLDSV